MVKFWDEALIKAIKKTQIRIKFMEKNGIGNSAMQEKAILKLQQRQLELKGQ